jgi:hypothetical protein
MKGGKKRKLNSVFKPGNKLQKRRWQDNSGEVEPQSTWSKRLKKEEFDRVTKTGPDGYTYTIPDADGNPGHVKLLRPKPASPDLADSYANAKTEKGGMRLLSKHRTVDMMNNAITKHAEQTKCNKLKISVHKEDQRGLCWRWTLSCDNCTFTSTDYQLYEEVSAPNKRGRKAAAPNRGLHVGLKNYTIGPSKARLIIAATNTPPPSRSSMQTTGRQVGEIITEVNRKDLRRQIETIKDTNQARGLPRESPINIQLDGTYNSYSMGSRRKPGQNASQVIGICREDMTDQHKVLGMHLQSKLCWTGAWLMGKGYDVQCPGGHANCTANTSQHEPLGEAKFGYEIGKELSLNNILIKHVTSDGDARSSKELERAQKELLDPMWDVSRLADRNHKAQCQYRTGQKAEFSGDMFPVRTIEKRNIFRKAFSADVKSRCVRMMEDLHKTCQGNTQVIAQKIPTLLDNVLLCYNGDCRRCRFTMTQCGGGKKTCWWFRSKDLRSVGLARGQINMTQQDYNLTKRLLEMQLSIAAVQEMRLHTSTQACEAANRAITASLPKTVKFSRDSLPRLSTAVHRINNGVGNSVHTLLEAVGAPMTRGSLAAKAVRDMQQQCAYSKHYHKRPAVKIRRASVQKQRTVDYMQNKLKGKTTRSDYCKDQLENIPSVRKQPPRRRGDHAYAKVARKIPPAIASTSGL